MAVSQQDILEDLNYLLGDTSVPSQGIENQKRFINRVIQDIYDRHDWAWSVMATDYTFNGMAQTLPTNPQCEKVLEVRERQVGQTGNDNIYTIGDYTNIDYTDSEYLAWVSGNTVDGYVLNINQADNPILRVSMKRGAETLTNPTDTTRIPRPMPIARGVYALMLQAEDPYRDITQETAAYEKSVVDLLRMEARREPKRRFYVAGQHRRTGEPR